MATYLPLLHRLVDAVSLLDMLHGFAQVASGSLGGAVAAPSLAAAAGRGYTRPMLTEGGPIALVEARHPVMECLDGGAYQPNDIFLALNSAFHIITGGPTRAMSAASEWARRDEGDMPALCASLGVGARAVLDGLIHRTALPGPREKVPT